ncbi:hypothetical protein MBBAR_6c01270 [Methanobrevibacter arboriphilus JCM 13429 = DSM 1125]|uniref:Uncharacterized protein n=1 Tax=Methanobrevibacter arboriphilus JCM 13429 = DSM 1125 TaxID=1300164 RepID=A0A1V6N332_METAZ|nr:hypothetical protein [Methanobrevibacter arboriphilus]OQD59017.1 hypothetical protein MBBAR_6c01270 [Methanobrevibacter arboriphilus JCM 13429 = DSM 1125]
MVENMNNIEKKPKIVEKTLDQLLNETESKITQGNEYYQTEKFRLGDGIIKIHFKLINQEIIMQMYDKKENERIPYLLSKSLYNPKTKDLFSEKQLDKFLPGGLAIVIAYKILQESGFDENVMKNQQLPF